MRRRQGFTIPELLVAMALIMFIMAILAEAFKAGLDSYRQLKAIGDMQERLRSVTSTLRGDLGSNHFSDSRVPGDPTIFTNRVPGGFFAIYGGTSPTTVPPAGTDGIITSVEMPLPPTPLPNFNTFPSLYFTVHNGGTDRQSYFGSRVPSSRPPTSFPYPSTFPLAAPAQPMDLSQRPPQDYWDVTLDAYHNTWSEVAYFVRANGRAAGTTPLYALYRRQLPLLQQSEADSLNTGIPRPTCRIPYSALHQGLFSGLSCMREFSVGPPPPPLGNRQFLHFNGPPNLGAQTDTLSPFNPNVTTNMLNRALWRNPSKNPPFYYLANNFPDYPAIPERHEDLRPTQDMIQGDDILMNDVLEFNVRILITTPGSAAPAPYDFMDVPATPLTVISPGPPVVLGAALPVFDTCAMRQPQYGGQPYVLMAVQITLRVWDVKTESTRQVTLVQNMTPN